ncbi:hypothetical protein QQS21_001215 [Conoideocrella luteorostrata]|uniref:NAD dependent epimerase/dehydratase n=1 Tax=Conoideocrella luteorostrata TaxID=1105319 RepID=A0AAJ0G273_9HYPO|nr:hypothetical protein QQS21_001215 [Conoideocrella luteorostrata]
MPRGYTPIGVPARRVPMRVIVHGLHRTGSMSTRTALHRLGFHNCYHMISVVENTTDDGDLWIQAMEAKYAGKGKKWTREDWDKLLGDSQACVDVPAALFTLDLIEAYPEAKVVILNRDPEKWYESVLESVYKNMQPPSLPGMLRSMYCAALDEQHGAWVRFCMVLSKYGMPFDHGKEKDKAIAWFNKQYQDVRDAVPADKRLEFSVKDGYRPLCEFLDVPVPMVKDAKTGEMVDAPYPHVNDRTSFTTAVAKGNSIRLGRANDALFTYVSKAVTLGLAGYGGYYLWKTRLSGYF